MSQPLFEPPPQFALVLSRESDLYVNFRPKSPDGDYIDYPADVKVTLVIERSDGDIRQDAQISGPNATVRIESTVTDAIPHGSIWRVVLEYPGDPSYNRVLCNGVTARSDGGLS